jgi:hypothetical protein
MDTGRILATHIVLRQRKKWGLLRPKNQIPNVPSLSNEHTSCKKTKAWRKKERRGKKKERGGVVAKRG